LNQQKTVSRTIKGRPAGGGTALISASWPPAKSTQVRINKATSEPNIGQHIGQEDLTQNLGQLLLAERRSEHTPQTTKKTHTLSFEQRELSHECSDNSAAVARAAGSLKRVRERKVKEKGRRPHLTSALAKKS
jgi:hypothetical protein